MKILLLGGTGAMGIYLTELLSKDKNNKITVTSRSKRKSFGNINYEQGNAHDVRFIETLLINKWDVIVDFMIYSTEEFYGRINLLLDGSKHYIFLSSARVYSDSNGPITEDSLRLLDTTNDQKFIKSDEYGLAKARQEDLLINSNRINWTIIRPYITYSKNRLQLGIYELQDWLPRVLKGKSLVFSEDIASKRTTLTFGSDVAKGIASIIGNPQTFAKKFNITSTKSLLWSEVLRIYFDAIEEFSGIRPKVKFLPVYPDIKKSHRKFQILYDRCYNRTFDTTSISEFCSVSEFISPEIGLKMCIKQYLTDNINKIDKLSFNYRSNIFFDKYAGEHTPLKEINGFMNKIKYCILKNLPYIALLLSQIRKIKNI